MRTIALWLLLICAPSYALEVEVLHWWTAQGEQQAIDALKVQWQAQGHQWRDFAVLGGGGGGAMMALKSRALAANPPEAAQLKGYELTEWAALGFLRDLTPLASAAGWDAKIPPALRVTLSHKGALMALPLGIHRVNWLWFHQPLLARHQLEAPQTWPQFLATAQALAERGIQPLALGREAWQLGILFEIVALGEGGADFYRRAFIERDAAALSG
ncbi:MAG: extracellular solute-binding protein, partial [Aeromonas sp.]